MFNNKKFEILFASASKNASFDSSTFEVEDMAGYAIQAKWTNQSGLAGSIKLQASNNKTDWDDVASSSQTFSGNGSFMWNVTTCFYRYVKVVVTISGGSATFYINGNAKGF